MQEWRSTLVFGVIINNNNTNKSSDVALVKRQTRNSAEIEAATDCSALR